MRFVVFLNTIKIDNKKAKTGSDGPGERWEKSENKIHAELFERQCFIRKSPRKLRKNMDSKSWNEKVEFDSKNNAWKSGINVPPQKVQILYVCDLRGIVSPYKVKKID